MLAIVLMMGLLLAPAIFNGFPIIFADTGGYLLRPIEGQLELGRSALYGAFLLAGIAFDFWPVVIVQAAVTCWIIVLTLRAFDLGERPGAALAVVLVLTLASSLPWYVGQLMLLTLQTGDGITADNNWHAEWVFREHAPHALKLYYRSAQSRNALHFTAINALQVPVALLATAVLPFLFVLLLRRRPAAAMFVLTMMMALLANAAICGVFAGPGSRYQSRLVPVAILAVMVGVWVLRGPTDRLTKSKAAGEP